MDELQISGRRFISSRRVAKEHGYHTDYIGQLIRGGKVKGQKVGRAWYVDAESFASYLGKEMDVPEVAAPVKDMTESPLIETEAPAAEAEEPKEEEKERPITEGVVTEAEIVSVEVSKVAEADTEQTTQEDSDESTETEESFAEPAPIPVRIAKQEAKGLRYYRDSEPLLPEMQSKQSVSRMHEAEDTDAVMAAPVRMAKIEPVAHRAPARRAVFALSVLAVATLVISTVVSSGVSLNTSIEATNTASTWYSFEIPYSGSF